MHDEHGGPANTRYSITSTPASWSEQNRTARMTRGRRTLARCRYLPYQPRPYIGVSASDVHFHWRPEPTGTHGDIGFAAPTFARGPMRVFWNGSRRAGEGTAQKRRRIPRYVCDRRHMSPSPSVRPSLFPANGCLSLWFSLSPPLMPKTANTIRPDRSLRSSGERRTDPWATSTCAALSLAASTC